MVAYEVLGGAWINSQEVSIAPIALNLVAVVLVGGESKHDLLTEDSDGLQALVTSDMIVARSSIGLDSIATYYVSCP